MCTLTLKQPVKIIGRDYTGRQAWIQFHPVTADGWFWRIPAGAGGGREDVPIELRLAENGAFLHCLSLRRFPYLFPLYEHIGALRFLGISGVAIESSPRPPFHGRVWELWNGLRSYLTEDEAREVQWCRPEAPSEWFYPNRKRYTEFLPHHDAGDHSLRVHIHCDYPGVGAVDGRFSFPKDIPILYKAFRIRTQGFPLWKYQCARCLALFGWPHFYAFTWPQECAAGEAREFFLLRRLVDVLGALSLVSHCRIPEGTVVSHCSGHRADLEALRRTRFVPC